MFITFTTHTKLKVPLRQLYQLQGMNYCKIIIRKIQTIAVYCVCSIIHVNPLCWGSWWDFYVILCYCIKVCYFSYNDLKKTNHNIWFCSYQNDFVIYMIIISMWMVDLTHLYKCTPLIYHTQSVTWLNISIQ